MQTFGLQVVLTSSNAVERVQQTALQHGAVTSAQFKDVIDKENEARKSEVGGLEQVAVEVRIREDLRHPGERREKGDGNWGKSGGTEEADEEDAPQAGPAEGQGHRLDVKI